jgi:predicted TIM-barrel fold metal-dependent hydrolase
MAQVTQGRNGNVTMDMTAPLAVVSGDSHCGPRFEDMRPYCPAALLDEFDSIGKMLEKQLLNFFDLVVERDGAPESERLRQQLMDVAKTDGHWDFHVRGREMDRDGVTADVIFHGSQNGQVIPWVGQGVSFLHTGEDLVNRATGLHIYNQWLADACSIEPERHVGAIMIPAWDVAASVQEVEWGRAAGLRGVNFPSIQPGVPLFNDPAWEPFWSACEALELPLLTHGGNTDNSLYRALGPKQRSIGEVESGGWMSRRALHWMLFSGVFERHPKLRLVFVEQPGGDWWVNQLRAYDSSWHTHHWQVAETVPEPPSFYCHRNCFIGASFMAPWEAQEAIREGFSDNIIWGTDYPHVEGTWRLQDDDREPMTRLSMRYCFADIPPEYTKAMVSDNAIRVFGFDGDALQGIAGRISAPTLEELATPIEGIPEDRPVFSLAFREHGPLG